LKDPGTKQENDSINGREETAMTEDSYKPTGKGKKARHRLNAIVKGDVFLNELMRIGIKPPFDFC